MNSRTGHPQPVPPKLKNASAWPFTWFTGSLVALVALVVGLVVYFFDPTKNPFYPGCAFHQLTGLNCPGCGATRSCYALLHGRWLLALHDNSLFVVSLAAMILRAAWQAGRHWLQLPLKPFIPTNWLIPWLVIAMIFGVLRNLPSFALLSP